MGPPRPRLIGYQFTTLQRNCKMGSRPTGKAETMAELLYAFGLRHQQ